MTQAKFLGAFLAIFSLGAISLFGAGPTSAMPGWSNSEAEASTAVTDKQRDQIEALHGAYRAALSELDWSIDDNGHAPETMQQARELRIALRAEIFDVLHRGSEVAGSASESGCPYNGKATPVRFGEDADTLYL